ncbi:MAG: NupC/NupG family nucleoside CNT transporter [Planctomycetota bacterium]
MTPDQLVSLFGFVLLPAIAFCFSIPYWRQALDARSADIKSARGSSAPLQEQPFLSRLLWVFPGRMLLWGMGLQLAFAFLLLKTEPGRVFFAGARDVCNRLMGFTTAGTSVVFGPALAADKSVVAINALMTIVFIGALTAMLYQLGILQLIVRVIAWLMRWTMGASGPESLGAAANIFIGPSESALTIKPYLAAMTRAELFALVTCGMATVSGNVLVVYAGMGADAGHLLTASIISAPAALMVARLMVPEVTKLTSDVVVHAALPPKPKVDGQAAHSGRQKKAKKEKAHPSPDNATPGVPSRRPYANLFDAAAQGAIEGIKLVMIIVGILIAFIALVAMLDTILFHVGGMLGANMVEPGMPGYDPTHWAPVTLNRILGIVFYPLAWLIGVPAVDLTPAAELLGKKTVLNEYLAYAALTSPDYAGLTPRTQMLLTYALCGFANFASIGIAIGTIGGLAPTRKTDIAKLAFRALIGGTLAALMTACVAGFMLSDAEIASHQPARDTPQPQTAPANP